MAAAAAGRARRMKPLSSGTPHGRGRPRIVDVGSWSGKITLRSARGPGENAATVELRLLGPRLLAPMVSQGWQATQLRVSFGRLRAGVISQTGQTFASGFLIAEARRRVNPEPHFRSALRFLLAGTLGVAAAIAFIGDLQWVPCSFGHQSSAVKWLLVAPSAVTLQHLTFSVAGLAGTFSWHHRFGSCCLPDKRTNCFIHGYIKPIRPGQRIQSQRYTSCFLSNSRCSLSLLAAHHGAAHNDAVHRGLPVDGESPILDTRHGYRPLAI